MSIFLISSLSLFAPLKGYSIVKGKRSAPPKWTPKGIADPLKSARQMTSGDEEQSPSLEELLRSLSLSYFVGWTSH